KLLVALIACTCASHKPGINTRPPTSSTLASAVLIGVSEISLMRPPVTSTSCSPSTAPPTTSRIRALRNSIELIGYPVGGRRGGTLQRGQRIHRTAEPLHVELIKLAVDLVEEDERIEPMQHAVLAHFHGHVAGTGTNHEFEVELLVRILLRELHRDEA